MKIIKKLISILIVLYCFGGSFVKAVPGRATYSDGGGFGACRTQINYQYDYFVSVSPSYWSDSICRLNIRVYYYNRSITVPVRDKCTSCTGNTIDLSQAAFIQLVGGLDPESVPIYWEFV